MEAVKLTEPGQRQAVPPKFKAGERQLLTGATPGAIAPNIIVAVRDPLGFEDDAATVIAQRLDEVELVANTGMFITYTGEFAGVPVTVISTGSGGPEIEIAVVELAGAVKEPAFVRVGTSGSAHPRVAVGDLVISTAAVRSEGTSRQYIDLEYPAVASYELVTALADAAQERHNRFHLGITRSTDSIYCGQGRDANGYVSPDQGDLVEKWTNAHVLNYERETATLLTIAALLGCRAASVCSVVNSAITHELRPQAGVEDATAVALNAFRLLQTRDNIKARTNQATWVPAMGLE